MGGAGVVFVAAFHVLEHLAALLVSEVVGGSGEVAGEESAEGGDGGGERGGERVLQGVGRSEEEGRRNVEALHIGVHEVTISQSDTSLERVANNEGGVGVVCGG